MAASTIDMITQVDTPLALGVGGAFCSAERWVSGFGGFLLGVVGIEDEVVLLVVPSKIEQLIT